MFRICLFLCLFPAFLLAQKSPQEYMCFNTKTLNYKNPLLQKSTYKINNNKSKSIRKYINSLQFIKGYKYNFDFIPFNQITSLSDVNNLLPIQNFSFLETNLLNTHHTDFKIKGSINVNGITNLMTLKGKLNKYDGNYFLQVSYHISSNNTSYIPKIVNERYQKGLALILKFNLEKGF